MNFSEIEQLISQLEELSTKEFNYEWESLIDNYSKLKYLEKIDYEITGSIKLMDSLRKFMEQMDKVTQHYLKEILWEKSLIPIKQYLSKSLNHNNPEIKLLYIIKAYDILVPIVEEIREQKCIQRIEDDDFIQTFKKRRIN